MNAVELPGHMLFRFPYTSHDLARGSRRFAVQRGRKFRPKLWLNEKLLQEEIENLEQTTLSQMQSQAASKGGAERALCERLRTGGVRRGKKLHIMEDNLSL